MHSTFSIGLFKVISTVIFQNRAPRIVDLIPQIFFTGSFIVHCNQITILEAGLCRSALAEGQPSIRKTERYLPLDI